MNKDLDPVLVKDNVTRRIVDDKILADIFKLAEEIEKQPNKANVVIVKNKIIYDMIMKAHNELPWWRKLRRWVYRRFGI